MAGLALVAWVVIHRVLKQHRRREQLRRRRQIRARLQGIAPGSHIDLTEPEAGIEIDLRDRVVYGSEITLESGDTIESGIVGPFPAE